MWLQSTVYGCDWENVYLCSKNIKSLKMNKDFYVGYSPRKKLTQVIKEHTVAKILKVTSGSTTETAEYVDKFIDQVIVAGTLQNLFYKVAEAARDYRNSQQDINIAFVNELSKYSIKWELIPMKYSLQLVQSGISCPLSQDW